MSKTGIAGANLKPSVFVKREGVTNDYEVLPASTGDFPSAITDSYSEDAPLPQISAADLDIIAEAGNPVSLIDQHGHEENSMVLLRITATVTRGQRLMPDATGDGTAIPVTAGNFFGAEALESGNAGEAIRVRPIAGSEPAA